MSESLQAIDVVMSDMHRGVMTIYSSVVFLSKVSEFFLDEEPFCFLINDGVWLLKLHSVPEVSHNFYCIDFYVSI